MPDTDSYESDALLPIGAAAKMLGVSVPTVRNYERRGLIEGRRTPTNHRRYLAADVRALRDGVKS